MRNKYISVVIPCYNEEDTIKLVIGNVKDFLSRINKPGEIIVVNNNCTDKSIKYAKEEKVKIVNEKKTGYGSALICGIKNAKGKYVIMADADCSYDFLDALNFIPKLEQGYDVVIGNRFTGNMEKKAMSFSHKYIGNPFLSFIGRRMFNIKIKDFHCGLRGFDRKKILNCDLKCSGMEFASEMIIKAKLNNLKITESTITLHADKRKNTKKKLKSFRDATRHIKLMIKLRKYYKNEK